VTDHKMTEEMEHAIREAESKATPGPWLCWNGWGPNTDGLMRVLRLGPDGEGGIKESVGQGDICGRHEDFEFITLSRAAVPALLSALDEARSEVQRLRGLLGWERGGVSWTPAEDLLAVSEERLARAKAAEDALSAERESHAETRRQLEELRDELGMQAHLWRDAACSACDLGRPKVEWGIYEDCATEVEALLRAHDGQGEEQGG